MNTTRQALALAAAGLTAGSAAAQSPVVISGVADVAARSVTNEGTGATRSMASGGNSTSRIIIRGQEDLGDGWFAGFHLEHGLLLNNGTPASSTAGQLWDRRSTVSVGAKTLGEFRGGRDFVPTYVNWSQFDPFTYVGVAGSNNLISATPRGPIRSAFESNANTTVRANEAFQWLLPGTWGGLEGGVLLAPGGGGPVAGGRNKVLGARLGWGTGPARISAAVVTTQNNLTTAGRFKDAAIGGAYDFGVVRVTAAWRRFEYADARQTNVIVGVTAPVGPVGLLKASWGRAEFDGRVGTTNVDANGARQIGLGYVHSLSKRTALYGTLSRLDNDGALTLAIPGGSSGMPAGGHSQGYEFGIRHNF